MRLELAREPSSDATKVLLPPPATTSIGFARALRGSSRPGARVGDGTWCLARLFGPCLYMLYYTILYYTILYYTILYYTILYYTILYYTILYYTILYCTTSIYGDDARLLPIEAASTRLSLRAKGLPESPWEILGATPLHAWLPEKRSISLLVGSGFLFAVEGQAWL